MLNLSGKVAFVTGAGSIGDDPDASAWGNGKSTAVLFTRRGATVFGVDLRHSRVGVRHPGNGGERQWRDRQNCVD